MSRDSLDHLIQFCLEELRLQARVLESPYHDQVVFSALYDHQVGSEVSAGSGNGTMAREKSFAECLEHYFYSNSSPEFMTVSASKVARQTPFKNDRVLATVDPASPLDCTIFYALRSTQNEPVNVPMDYICPLKTPHRHPTLSALCSSSGFSFHQNQISALQHGLFEVIERHEFSKFLLQHLKGSRVQKETLPPQLKQRIERVESAFPGKIEIVQIHGDLGLFTSLAVFFPDDQECFPIPQVGSKTTSTLLSSIDGAQNELMQILALYTEEERTEDSTVIRLRGATHKADLDLAWVLDLPTMILEDSEPQRPAISEVLDRVVRSLERQGFAPLYRTVHEFRNRCSVTQVFVPGFEKYNLIRAGKLVPVHVR